MGSEYEFEFSKPNVSSCECCGGLSVRLTRYVHKEGAAFAVYCAAYSNNHPDDELAMLLSLGEWGEGSAPSKRAAFYCRVRPVDGSYQVMLGDAADSGWSDAEIFGQMLSRQDALAHEWKATAFNVLDEAFLHDRSLRGFLDRVHCGDVSNPLERRYQSPDEIHALAPAEKSRAENRGNFASLDGKRFFIRCLMSVPVEHYDQWNISMWFETSKEDFVEVSQAWDDPEKYAALRFKGRVANDIERDLALPVPAGTEVIIHIRDTNEPPYVKESSVDAVAQLLSKMWPQTDFETYAVTRGFL